MSKELPKKFPPFFPFPDMLPVLLEGCHVSSSPCLRHNSVSSAQDKYAQRMSQHEAVIFLSSATSHQENFCLIRLWLSTRPPFQRAFVRRCFRVDMSLQESIWRHSGQHEEPLFIFSNPMQNVAKMSQRKESGSGSSLDSEPATSSRGDNTLLQNDGPRAGIPSLV